MRNLWIVTRFTMRDMLKKKSFIASVIIILAIIVLAFNIPNILKLFGEESFNTNVLVIDKANLFEGSQEVLNSLELGYNFEITNKSLISDEIKTELKDNVDICIEFTKNENIVNMNYIVESASMDFGQVPQPLISAFTSLYSNIQISKLNISPEQIAAIQPEFNVTLTETDENAAQGNVLIMMIISVVLFYVIFFCAQQVSVAITTEKTSKIIETLVTSTDSKTIVLGKTLGIGIVGLVQISLMIITALITAKFCMDPEVLSTIFDLSTITPKLIIITLIYFCLGYALYSLIFALTGATVSKPEDVQYANGPVNMISVAGFYLAYFTMMNPSSNLNQLAGIIPISSPFCMPLRVMMRTTTSSELLLSLGILLITTILLAALAIKVYSATILNTGARLKLKEAIKMAKENKE